MQPLQDPAEEHLGSEAPAASTAGPSLPTSSRMPTPPESLEPDPPAGPHSAFNWTAGPPAASGPVASFRMMTPPEFLEFNPPAGPYPGFDPTASVSCFAGSQDYVENTANHMIKDITLERKRKQRIAETLKRIYESLEAINKHFGHHANTESPAFALPLQDTMDGHTGAVAKQKPSRLHKLKWATGDKQRLIEQVEWFENMVQVLDDLAPPVHAPLLGMKLHSFPSSIGEASHSNLPAFPQQGIKFSPERAAEKLNEVYQALPASRFASIVGRTDQSGIVCSDIAQQSQLSL